MIILVKYTIILYYGNILYTIILYYIGTILVYTNIPANPVSRRHQNGPASLSRFAFRASETFFSIFTPPKMHFYLRPPMNRSTCILRGRRSVLWWLEKNHFNFRWQAREILAFFDFLGGWCFIRFFGEWCLFLFVREWKACRFCVAGAVICDGWKRAMLIFAGRRTGFLPFWMCMVGKEPSSFLRWGDNSVLNAASMLLC